MEAVGARSLVRRRGRPRRRWSIPALPTLRPAMLAGGARTALPFPLDAAGARFYYFARNAVWAAVKLLGLPGKEVLVPAYHHGVEIEALVDAGAVPRFYPLGVGLSLDPHVVVARMTRATAAVYVIHYLGFPQPLDEIVEACRARGIPLIEDCALAGLSTDGERPLGSRGDVGIFCLYKTFPVPNGGVLVVNGTRPRGVPPPVPPPWTSTASHVGSSLLENLRLRGGPPGHWLADALRLAGRAVWSGAGATRVPTGTQHFERAHVQMGAAKVVHRILAAQDFARIVEVRRRNFFLLMGRLRDVAPPLVQELAPGVCPLFFPLVVARKSEVRRGLAARGIEAIDFWRTGHPAVRPGEFSDVDRLRETVIELPSHQDLSPAAMEFVAQSVREVLGA